MEELQLIADLCKKHNVICISDEVYEWLVYGGEQHIRIGKLLLTDSLFNFINIYGNNRSDVYMPCCCSLCLAEINVLVLCCLSYDL